MKKITNGSIRLQTEFKPNIAIPSKEITAPNGKSKFFKSSLATIVEVDKENGPSEVPPSKVTPP